MIVSVLRFTFVKRNTNTTTKQKTLAQRPKDGPKTVGVVGPVEK
jgi:hypothetical protein